MNNKGLRIMKTVALSMAIVLFGLSLSFAQQYPNRPINVLLGYGAGGTIDTSFRPLAKAAEKYLGQSLMITNNGAGQGTVALGLVAKEKPDGYYLNVCHTGMLTMTPHLREVPYKLEDFVPVAGYGVPRAAIAVKADSPWKTVKDLVEYARKNPGKVTYFAVAPGSSNHLAVEFIAKQEKVKFNMVPFQGGAPALAALLGGHIDLFSGSAFIPQAKAGEVRILAFYTEKRVKDFPNVPTFRDLGYNYAMDDIFFISAPKGTPSSVVQTLQEAFKKATEDQAFIQGAEKMEVIPGYYSAQDVQKYLMSAYGRYGKMIQEMNIPREGGSK